MKNYTAKDIAWEGDRFYRIASSLYEESNVPNLALSTELFIHNMTPIIINGCIACELYFKALLFANGVTSEKLKSRKYGHNLVSLYDEVAKYLSQPLYESMGVSKEIFDNELEIIKTAFVDWRYYYELLKDGTTISFTFIVNLGKTLKEICKSALGNYALNEYRGTICLNQNE